MGPLLPAHWKLSAQLCVAQVNLLLLHMRHTLWFRKQIEVCTDPLRRCYDGFWAKSELQWTGWGEICTYSSKEIAESSGRTFKRINPGSEYLALPEGENPNNQPALAHG